MTVMAKWCIAGIFLVLSGTLYADDLSRANLDVVKSTYKSPAGLLAALSPKVQWVEMKGHPYAGTYTAKEELLAKVFSKFGSDWEAFMAKPQRFIKVDNGIMVIGDYSGKHKATGKFLQARFVHMYTLENGKITAFEQFTDTYLFHKAMN